jgi:hypothetical protein
VDLDAARGGFGAEVASGEAEVVFGGAVRLAVAREDLDADAERERRGEAGPRLIRFDQAREQAREFLAVFAARDELAPGLLVVRGRRPARGFEEAREVCGAHAAVGEDVGAEAFDDQRIHRMIAGCSLHEFHAHSLLTLRRN